MAKVKSLLPSAVRIISVVVTLVLLQVLTPDLEPWWRVAIALPVALLLGAAAEKLVRRQGGASSVPSP